ncbi:10910_t:CDS:2 [Diversispora eburnea]|uniref:10910_t:CDS:1 n=1 Tax=Diversispora eburnea TaxID=1213867 RepID=A0A9N8UWK8_9GLOM|nr:10910_t:CDS:2 [Diversispora eburnea]
MPNQLLNAGPIPLIIPPYPPSIDLKTLIVKQPDGKIPAKAPNAFIIYRKVFIGAAREKGYYLPMPIVSSMASQAWKKEPELVKEEYKRLAKEAFDLRNELSPKSGRRRKREKWNIISFKKPSTSTSIKSSSLPTTPTIPVTELQKSPSFSSCSSTSITPPVTELQKSPSFSSYSSTPINFNNFNKPFDQESTQLYFDNSIEESPSLNKIFDLGFNDSETHFTNFPTSPSYFFPEFPIIQGESWNYDCNFTQNIVPSQFPFEGLLESLPLESNIWQYIAVPHNDSSNFDLY